MLQNDDDPVSVEPDGPDLGPERELADAPALVAVPQNDLVGRVHRVGPAAYEGHDRVLEVHIDDRDSPYVDLSADDLAERVAAEDPEAAVHTRREAPVIAEERQAEQRRWHVRVRDLAAAVGFDWLVGHGGIGIGVGV